MSIEKKEIIDLAEIDRVEDDDILLIRSVAKGQDFKLKKSDFVKSMLRDFTEDFKKSFFYTNEYNVEKVTFTNKEDPDNATTTYHLNTAFGTKKVLYYKGMSAIFNVPETSVGKIYINIDNIGDAYLHEGENILIENPLHKNQTIIAVCSSVSNGIVFVKNKFTQEETIIESNESQISDEERPDWDEIELPESNIKNIDHISADSPHANFSIKNKTHLAIFDVKLEIGSNTQYDTLQKAINYLASHYRQSNINIAIILQNMVDLKVDLTGVNFTVTLFSKENKALTPFNFYSSNTDLPIKIKNKEQLIFNYPATYSNYCYLYSNSSMMVGYLHNYLDYFAKHTVFRIYGPRFTYSYTYFYGLHADATIFNMDFISSNTYPESFIHMNVCYQKTSDPIGEYVHCNFIKNNQNNNAIGLFRSPYNRIYKLIFKNCQFKLNELAKILTSSPQPLVLYFYKCRWDNITLDWTGLNVNSEIHYQDPGFTVPKDDNRFKKIEHIETIPSNLPQTLPKL